MPTSNNDHDNAANDTAGQARTGLLETVTGKAKEIAGALTGNDELTEEGQLRQAKAAAQREASASDALAQAKAEQATAQLREDTQRAEQQRRAAHAEAEDRARRVSHAAAAEQASIDAEAAQREEAEQAQARKQGAAELARNAEHAQRTRATADAHERDGQHQHNQLHSEADAELDQAAQLRRQAAAVGSDNDLEGPR